VVSQENNVARRKSNSLASVTFMTKKEVKNCETTLFSRSKLFTTSTLILCHFDGDTLLTSCALSYKRLIFLHCKSVIIYSSIFSS